LANWSVGDVSRKVRVETNLLRLLGAYPDAGDTDGLAVGRRRLGIGLHGDEDARRLQR